jgi:ketosteroid isomerase-like protein
MVAARHSPNLGPRAILPPVSGENVEIVAGTMEAFNQRGVQGLLDFADPEIEWTTTGLYLEAGTYRGAAGIRRYIGALIEEFENARIGPHELIDAGNSVIAPARFTGRGKRSGAAVELTLTSVYTVEEGKIIRVRNFDNKGDALRAVGLEAT